MKKYIVTSLLLLLSGTALAMESEALSRPGTIAPILETPDLRRKLMTSLYEISDTQQAHTDFKAFSCVDRTSSQFYRDSELQTQNFVFSLYKMLHQRSKYGSTIEISPLLAPITPFLNTPGIELFEGKLLQGDALVNHTMLIAAQNDKWNSFLALLNHGLASSFKNTAIHYYWFEKYENREAYKTPLIKALEFDAPANVIEALLNLGAEVKNLPGTTPPPCLIVTKNYLKCRKELTEAQNNNTEFLEKKLQQLEAVMDLLLKRGACLYDSFCINLPKRIMQTPLSAAIDQRDLSTVEFLIKKGAQSFDLCDLCALSSFYCLPNGEEFLSIGEALLAIPSNAEHFLYYLLAVRIPAVFADPKGDHEEILTLFPWFLDKVKDLNAPVPYEEDLSFLDIARLYGNDERIITLLIEKGATTKESNTQRVECMLALQDLHKTYKKLTFKKEKKLLAKDILKETRAAIHAWGFEGMALAAIKGTLCLANGRSTMLELAEFFKDIMQKEQFRPFFYRREHIFSIDQLLYALSSLTIHDPKVLKLLKWLKRETSTDSSSAHAKILENSDASWEKLVETAFTLGMHSVDSRGQLVNTFATAKVLMLHKKADILSLTAAVCLLPLVDGDFTRHNQIFIFKNSSFLETKDFRKWAKKQNYLLDEYSHDLSRGILGTLINFCSKYPINDYSLLGHSITWLADHTIQEKAIFEHWKAIAAFTRDQNLPELAAFIEQAAQEKIEKL